MTSPVMDGAARGLRAMRSREETIFEETRAHILELQRLVDGLTRTADRVETQCAAFRSAETMAHPEAWRLTAQYDLTFIEEFLQTVELPMLRAALRGVSAKRRAEIGKIFEG